MHNDDASLFDNEKIEWGTLEVPYKNEKTQVKNYIYILNKLTLKFPDLKAQVENPLSKEVFCK